MSKLVFNRDGGKTDEFGHLLGLARSMQGEVIEGLLVAANGSPNMTVNVPIGTAMIPTSSGGTAYKYFVGLDATESVAITTANPSNPRNDLIVMYVDVAVTPSQSYTNNSNNMLKLAAVAGTPAASPADPSIANIQAAIGAANPYIILARVVVGAGVTQINSGNITDLCYICVPRRVDSSSFVDNTLQGTKLAANSIPTSKIDSTTIDTFIAYRGTAYTLVVSAFTRMPYNTTINNNNSVFNTTTGVFTAQVAGMYMFSSAITVTASVSRIFLAFFKNGSEYIRSTDLQASAGGVTTSCMMLLAVGDTVEIQYYCNAAVAIVPTQMTSFSGALIKRV